MKLSIVTTLYRSAPHLAEFYQRASAVARAHAGSDYEIVMVNDGSPDDSLRLALGLLESDPHLKVVDLSRNFGHHKAIMEGLAHSRGEEVFLIDSDLEESPEWLEPFAKQRHEDSADVVYGVQASRKGGVMERWSGALYYWLMRRLAGVALPRNLVTARLMSRRYVDSLLQFREREMFLSGLWYLTGFHQVAHEIVKLSHSETTYGFRQKVYLLINSVVSISNRPLILIFYTGMSIFGAALLYSVYLVFNWLVASRPPNGWTSVMVSVWLLGGLVISFLGVIGIYLSKVFSETKQRPNAIVKEVHVNTEQR
ncbi:Polymyxin resistance protein ArnC, glycosyl transferase [plant metagenome]|uniref:Polymyxin resistance protein ArnC, glycosyl transferase n=1 Tax=plant metagenome TaxID=1297885 RepID=A0A484RQY3_9ZZZZ